MGRIRIVHTQIPGYDHLEALTEVRESLVAELGRLGWNVSESRTELDAKGRNIVLGAHVLDDATMASLPAGTIVYNFEQIDGTSMLPPERLAAYRRFDVWDYSVKNVAGWEEIGIDARHVPVGHSPVLERIDPASEQDIDVLFYGSVNDRRRRVLEEIDARGHRVHVAFGAYGEARDRLIARSRCAVNIHFYEAGILEVVRLSYLFANAVPVVSEWRPALEVPDGLRDAARFAAHDDLADAVDDLLSDDAERRTQGDRGRAAMRAIPYGPILRDALGPVPESNRPAPTGRTGGRPGRKGSGKKRRKR